MRLNELPLHKNLDRKSFRIFEIVFLFDVENHRFSWRGRGQSCPENTVIAGICRIAIIEKGMAYVPVAVSIPKSHRHTCSGSIYSRWSEADLFLPHSVELGYDGLFGDRGEPDRVLFKAVEKS